jgi:hypothetical protein
MNLGLIVVSRKPDVSGAELGTREYRYLDTTKISTMEKEMNKNEALAAGYQLLDLATLKEQLIILGRVVQADAKPGESTRD